MSLRDFFSLGFRGRLQEQEPLSRHTSLKVGGPADLYAVPEDEADLLQLVGWLDERRIPRFIMGGGYNILVRDGGIRGAVISLEKFSGIDLIDPHHRLLRAGAGTDNLTVVHFAQEHGLGGIGFIAGIPGTVGGAMKMNAGAYGSGILEHTRSLTLLRDGSVSDYLVEELEYGYRRLDLLPGDIILAALFSLILRDPAETEQEIRKDQELRRTKHCVGHPSAGSFFKNPSGQAAWRLMDQAGLRGKQVGGAQVSPVHSNFLVNVGGATARDFLELAAVVKEQVKAVTGIELEEEVRILGEL
jgi:UDP-N-acetylmuramate dehydrogenase